MTRFVSAHGLVHFTLTSSLHMHTLSFCIDGLVDGAPPAVLPPVGPLICVGLIVLFSLPAVLAAWTKKEGDRLRFTYVVANVAFSTFMFGYHVHEKAIMTSVVLYGTAAFEGLRQGRLFLRLR